MKLRLAVATLLAAVGMASAARAESAAPAAAENTPTPAPAAADATTSAPLYTFPELGKAPVIKEPEALGIFSTHGSDLLVVNYWATWCGPCVEELPHFFAVAKKHPTEQVRFVGYSMDSPRQREKLVEPFLLRMKATYPNIILWAEPNDYISKVSEKWGGELPATFFYDRQGNKLAEVLGAMTEAELEQKVEALLKQAKAKAE